MAKRKENEPHECPECGRKLLSKKDLKLPSLSLRAAAAVLGTASEVIDEAIADGEGATKALHLLQRVWWLGLRADALSEDIEDVLPEVAERLAADEPHAELAANTNGSPAVN